MAFPMVRFAVLGSGSASNAYIFEDGENAFCVDNGFSFKEFSLRAEEAGFDLGKLRCVFLTHCHEDHIRGVGALSRKLKIPVAVHRDLDLAPYLKGKVYKRLNVEVGKEAPVGGISCIPFKTMHDAPHSVSYHFSLGGVRFTLITDTGIVTEEMFRYACISDVIFLEANYNPFMLEQGPYPQSLKKRIKGRYGHLSNPDAIDFLNRVHRVQPSKSIATYFCHLSDVNNSSAQLEADIASSLSWSGSYVICPKNSLVSGEFSP
ncbi:MAG TPA: MBL fold metallo-hydrolase [Spirochaetia bacterium]|nr:MBL fold metallo-hydrolase [Spirochaetia bacterium]